MIVTTRKVPFRLTLREGRPIIIEVSIRNNASRERKYVVSIETDSNLSLSPTGPARFGEKKTPTLYPGESQVVAFKVYPRATTRPGDYEVTIRVDECLESYDNVLGTKVVSVRVPVI